MAVLTTEQMLKRAGNTYISPSRIYLNSERTKVVPESHKDASWLLAHAGGEISEEDAEKYGLIPANPSPSPAKIEDRETRVPKNLTTR